MRHLLLPTLLALLTGCTEKDDTGETDLDTGEADTADTTETGETGESDTGETDTGETDTGPTGTLDVLVLDPNDPGLGPVAGVTIAVDTREGDRIEAITDENGAATLAVDFEDITGIISHADGRGFCAISPERAAVAVAAGTPVVLSSWALAEPPGTDEPVSVSGALLNKTAPEHEVRVLTSAGGAYNRPDTTSYEVFVTPNEAFTLVGLEWATNSEADRIVDETFYGWVYQAHEGVSSSTVLDLDFAAPAATRTVGGSIATPPHDQLTAHGRLTVGVSAQAAVGYAFSTEPSKDNRAYAFKLQYLDLPEEELETTILLTDPLDDYSLIYLEGAVPSPGVIHEDLLPPPLRSGPIGNGPFEWSTLISWHGVALTDPDTSIVVAYTTDVESVGVAYVLPDEADFRLPALPSTSTRLTDGVITATVAECGTTDDDPRCEKWAQGAGFAVISPFEEGG